MFAGVLCLARRSRERKNDAENGAVPAINTSRKVACGIDEVATSLVPKRSSLSGWDGGNVGLCLISL